jgi:hypothetical protein
MKIKQLMLAPIALGMIAPVAANAADLNLAAVNQHSAEQVTSVTQFSDVRPTDWAYQAISNLVSRYGCVAGFPNGTFQPGQPATRAQLAALTSACLDRISEYQTAADAALAAALRAQFSKEIAATNTRVSALEVAAARKAQGVGNYLGIGVALNSVGTGSDPSNVVSGGTLQGRYAVKNFSNNNAVSVRPYINAVAGPDSQIGAAGGVTATYDFAIARKAGVSAANIYTGVGYQVPFVNDTQANAQNAVGLSNGQAVFVLGAEGRITNSLVGFADLKFPTNTSANSGSYSPVFTTGLGFKF